MSKQKVTLRIEEGEVELLKEKFKTDNQSECKIFVDLFCGSIAMLCYLSWDVKVVINDINGNLTKQGNRRLQATIYFLAIQMMQISSKGTPRHPAFRAYYEKRKAEGKSSQQALICISRRLISIIYGMLKSGTEYRMPVVENTGENL